MLPGRLGTPSMTLADDPRADPRMLAAMAPIGLDGAGEAPPVAADAPIDDLVGFCGAAEEGFEALFGILGAGSGATDSVSSTVEVIRGIDGNDITLFIHRPTDTSGPLPGLLHLHGGGMVILEAAGPGFAQWRNDLAATGMVVVGVEFRNGAGKHGPYPFPAGLNDCTSALQWVTDNKQRLGIDKVVISGESGGGNLTLATTLKAKQDGRLAQIDGVYAQCPYISNGYGDPPAALPSLTENDGYFLRNDMMAIMARVYDPNLDNAANPLAWPYFASVDDVRGLPPHVISVNQLDPLRDEGLAYFRKLLDGGVSAVSRTVNGTCHAGDCIFVAAMPDVYMATIRDIHSFAASL
jgi:acetyl esterase